jgi:hypothetical protein
VTRLLFVARRSIRRIKKKSEKQLDLGNIFLPASKRGVGQVAGLAVEKS